MATNTNASPLSLRFLTKGHEAYQQGRWADALAAYTKCAKLTPKDARIWNEIGGCHKNMGERRKALTAFMRAVECDPNMLQPHYNLGLTAYELGDYVQAEQCYLRAISLKTDHQQVWRSLLCLYAFVLPRNPEFVYAAHKMWASRFIDPLLRGHKALDVKPLGSALRIGYISSDLRLHAVANFMNPVLRAHKLSGQLDVYVFYNWPHVDGVSDSLREVVGEDKWFPVSHLSDDDLCNLIRLCRIDILIDLNGLTLGGRLEAIAQRPAPVQCTWIGYISTTGMKAFDYRIVDEFVAPPHMQRHYSEKLYYLPLFCIFSPMGNSPEVTPAPVVRNGYITYGSVNNFTKITDEVLRAWVAILVAVPDSRLLLVASNAASDPRRADDIYRIFTTLGLGNATSRIILRDTKPIDQFMNYYAEIDVCLDTFPYTGGTTTMHTMWMGVPIITQIGAPEISRIAADFMAQTGLEGWITKSTDEYIALAIAVGTDLEARAVIVSDRMLLRDRMNASQLMQHYKFTSGLENAYHDMWLTYTNKGKVNGT